MKIGGWGGFDSIDEFDGNFTGTDFPIGLSCRAGIQ